MVWAMVAKPMPVGGPRRRRLLAGRASSHFFSSRLKLLPSLSDLISLLAPPFFLFTIAPLSAWKKRLYADRGRDGRPSGFLQPRRFFPFCAVELPALPPSFLSPAGNCGADGGAIPFFPFRADTTKFAAGSAMPMGRPVLARVKELGLETPLCPPAATAGNGSIRMDAASLACSRMRNRSAGGGAPTPVLTPIPTPLTHPLSIDPSGRDIGANPTAPLLLVMAFSTVLLLGA
mmetsp:Transcript_55799/g.167228  ORF Transcript_55799/g.167228 Transcript_55799/m.167228 type:complete len:232 (+) Transcript_55799:1915-2610(+)